MNKRRHSIIMAVWLVGLITVAVVFWDRLVPSDGRPATDTSQVAPEALGGQPPEESPAEPLLMRIHQALRAKNPAYNGRGQFQMTAGEITVADLSATGIVDPSPLRQLPLEALDLSDNPVGDLTSLRGMALKRLALEATEVIDLAPLEDMQLTELYLNNTRVADLAPLAGMLLDTLNLYKTDVKDLSPLQGMPLKLLWLNGTKVSDISPLAGCLLVSLTLAETSVADISPLAGATLRRLHIGGTAVTDLTPLEDVQLDRLIFTPDKITRGLAIIRNMESIREIGLTLGTRMPPDQFWALYDQGEFR